MTHQYKPAKAIQAGDTILPPERELRLWMQRENSARGLPEAALHLTVLSVEEAMPDKRGRWLLIKTQHSPEWRARPFAFKARPETPWPTVQR